MSREVTTELETIMDRRARYGGREFLVTIRTVTKQLSKCLKERGISVHGKLLGPIVEEKVQDMGGKPWDPTISPGTVNMVYSIKQGAH